MKPRYSPSELELLHRYVDCAFPIRRRSELLPGRSKPSIQRKLNEIRRANGTLYRLWNFEARGQ